MADESKSKKPEVKDDKSDNVEKAVAEVKEEVPARVITVRGQEFTLPDKQPADILFAARAISRASRTGDEGSSVEAMMDMAISYIGEGALRSLLVGKPLEDGVAVLTDLLEQCAQEYGTSLGES